MQGNMSGGVEHSFPEASSLPGFALRDGVSQSHKSEGEEL